MDQLFSSNRNPLFGGSDATSDQIVIGLVNNMPDGALQSTDRQFAELLTIGAAGRAVSLRIFSIAGLPRAETGRRYAEEHHEHIEALWSAKLDGLIVTGMEPRSPNFEDEPYWPIFAKLVDWADDCTLSTVWSCLAAHAAAYRLDGIQRRALGGKLTGVFQCLRRSDHTMLDYLPARWPVPHSRYYELPEKILLVRGYSVLTRSTAVGADMFAKHGKTFHVFLQGHPEYEVGALGLEYRRDVKRYLRGERATYPEIPRNYFTQKSEALLSAFRQRALQERSGALLSSFPQAEGDYGPSPPSPWQSVARQLYGNWLSYLAEQKSLRRRASAPDIKQRRTATSNAIPAHALL
jgi:homoserine O-succinyltransferase